MKMLNLLFIQEHRKDLIKDLNIFINNNDCDTDGDGICDDEDECPFDINNDSDGDGICDSEDICPDDTNNDSDNDSKTDSSTEDSSKYPQAISQDISVYLNEKAQIKLTKKTKYSELVLSMALCLFNPIPVLISEVRIVNFLPLRTDLDKPIVLSCEQSSETTT